MKKGILKQAFAFVLAITMIVTSMPTTYLAAESATSDVTMQEVEETVSKTTAGAITVESVELDRESIILTNMVTDDSILVTAHVSGGNKDTQLMIAFEGNQYYTVVSAPLTYVSDGVYQGSLVVEKGIEEGWYYFKSLEVNGEATDYYDNLSFKVSSSTSNPNDTVTSVEGVTITDITLSETTLTVDDFNFTDQIKVTAQVEGAEENDYISVLFQMDAGYGNWSAGLTQVEEGVYEGYFTVNKKTEMWNPPSAGEYYFASVSVNGTKSGYYKMLNFVYQDNYTGIPADGTVDAIALDKTTLSGTTDGSDCINVTANLTGGNAHTTVKVVYEGTESKDNFEADLTFVEAGVYQGAITSAVGLSQSADTYVLKEIYVNDTLVDVAVDSSFTYTYDAIIAIESLSLSTEDVVLNDTTTEVTMDVSLVFSEETVVDADRITLIYRSVKNSWDTTDMYLYRVDDTNTYSGQQTFELNSYKYNAGTYVLDSITMHSTNGDIAVSYNGTSSYEVSVNISDQDAPIVESVSIYKYDADTATYVQVENGTTLATTDTIQVRANISDASEISYAEVYFCSPTYDKWESPSIYMELHEDGYYVGEASLEEWSNEVWSIASIEAQDALSNYGEVSNINIYFSVADENGTTQPAEYNVDVTFYMMNRPSIYKNVVTTSNMITLRDIIGEDIENTSSPYGLTLLGWDIGSTNTVEMLQWDDTINLAAMGSSVFLTAVFDQVNVNLSIEYWGEDGLVVESYTAYVPRGTTFTEFEERFMDSEFVTLSEVAHANALVAESWTSNVPEYVYQNNTQVYYNQYIRYTANYDKIPVSVTAEYYNEEGRIVAINLGEKFLEKGTTYEEYGQNLEVSGITHHSSVNFKNWAAINPSGSAKAVIKMGLLTVEAQYDKIPVNVAYAYYNEENQFIIKTQEVLIDKRETYRTALAQSVVPEVNHTDDLGGFVDWEVTRINYYGDEVLDDIAQMGSTIVVSAQYATPAVEVRTSYIDEDGEAVEMSELVVVEEGDTYQNVYAEYKATTLDSLIHSSNYELKGWTYSCGGRYAIGKKAVVATASYIQINPEYKMLVDLENLNIKSVTTDITTATLTDTRLTQDVKITMKAAGIPEDASVCVRYAYNEYLFAEAWLTYASDGVYKGTATLEYGYSEGTYKLSEVYINDIPVEFDVSSSFKLVKKNTDKTSPVVESVQYYDTEGNEVEPGVTLSGDDTITVKVKATDNKKLYETGFVVLGTRSTNVNMRNQVFYLEYDKEDDVYIGSISVADLYATEWYVQHIQIDDIYRNMTMQQDDFYFYVEDANGECDIPTITYSVCFNMPGHYGTTYEVTTSAVTSLSEMFPSGVPVAPEVEGATFLGWDILLTDEQEKLSNDDKIIVRWDTTYGFRPVYDKTVVDVSVNYWNRDGYLSYETITVEEEFGITYRELINNVKKDKYDIDLDDAKHTKKLTFNKWNTNVNASVLDEEVGSFETVVFNADYNKMPINVFVQYLDEDGVWTYKKVGETFVTKGTTYGEYLSKFNPKGIKHYEALNFENWTYGQVPFNEDDAINMIQGSICIKAEYDKVVATIDYNYFAIEGWTEYETETILLEKGATYQDAIDASTEPVAADAHTDKLGEFQGWDYTIDVEGGASAEVTNGTNIYAEAQYEQQGIYVYYEYCDVDGNYTGRINIKPVEAGDTYNDVFQDLCENVLPAPEEHNQTMGFLGWEPEIFGHNWGVPMTTVVDGIAAIQIWPEYEDYENISITVAFDTNGGNALSEETAKKVIRKEDVLGTLPTPTKEGYTFAGWNTEADGTGTTVKTTTRVSYPLTLFAQWTPNTYSVKFNANGGSGKMSNLAATYDKSVMLTANAFKRTGYDFAGWATEANGEVAFMNMEEVVNLTAEKGRVVNLYAKWIPIEYTINFVLNDTQEDPAVFEEANPTVYNATMDAITLENPTREHYQFAGWYSDAKFKTKVTNIKAGSTGDKTFYAKWMANKYTINFNKNDEAATGKMNAMTNLAYDKEYKLTKLGFAKKGYNFLGWNTQADGNGTTYDNLAQVQGLVEENGGSITLYAVWEKATYTVTYNLNGGTNGENNPSSYQVDTEKFTLENPTKEGYTFEGWYSDAKLKKKASTTIKEGSTGNKTFYAKWTANKYTIKFNKNVESVKEGLIITGAMKNQSMTYDKQTALSANGFKLKGYAFKGWATTPNGSVVHTNKEKVSNLTAAKGGVVELFAVWEKETYTITYANVDGAENPNTTTTYDIDLTEDIVLKKPTREGYIFKAWYADAKFKKAITKIAAGSTGNKTVYAKWVGDHDYTINFVAVDEGVTGSTKAIKGVKYGKSVALTANGFKKTGYNFVGWATEETLNNEELEGTEKVVYTNKQKVVDLADVEEDSVTLYAVFELAEYTITYKDGGEHENATSYTILADDNIELAPASKEGYTFKGWYADAKFKKAITTLELEGKTGNKTVYARWSANKYTITFDANAEANHLTQDVTGTTKKVSTSYGKKTALSANGFKVKGFKFLGWATTPDGEVVYKDKAKVENLTADVDGQVTLYAKWDIVNYSIKYVLNGGTNHVSNPTNYNVAGYIYLNNPSKEGYTFQGWYTDKNFKKKVGENPVAEPGTTGNKTFYAKWKANSYTITYDKNLGEGAMEVTGTMKDVKNVTYGKTVVLKANTFKRTGYKFLGWSTSADGSTGLIKNKAKVSNLTKQVGLADTNNATVILYAQWDITEYTITYKLNGGTLSEEAQTTYTVEDAFLLEEPTMDGYEFVGWYSDAKGTKKVEAIQPGKTGDLTLYALWRRA